MSHIFLLTHLASSLLVADPEEADEPGPVGQQRAQHAGQRGEEEAGRPPGDPCLEQDEAEAQREPDSEVHNSGKNWSDFSNKQCATCGG